MFGQLLNYNNSQVGEYIATFPYPWQALTQLKNYVLRMGATLKDRGYIQIAPTVWAHKTANVSPNAHLGEACIIGAGATVRQGACLRSAVVLGDGALVGSSSEVKNSVLFNGAKIPHLNYVGDSILGTLSHFGAGAIASNQKSDKSQIFVEVDGERLSTGLTKLGALVGDNVEIGCNCVLCPGTVIGANTSIYPLNTVRGTVFSNKIFKRDDDIVDRV